MVAVKRAKSDGLSGSDSVIRNAELVRSYFDERAVAAGRFVQSPVDTEEKTSLVVVFSVERIKQLFDVVRFR